MGMVNNKSDVKQGPKEWVRDWTGWVKGGRAWYLEQKNML